MSESQAIPSPAGVSIVIPHHGDPALAATLVGDLRAQITSRPVQIIVADDHSPEPFPTDGDRARGCEVVRRATNGGFGAAVNTGAAAAVHPLLLILNSDLRIGEDFVESLCALAEPWMPAVVGPALVDPDGTVRHTARRFPSITRSALAGLTPLARWRSTERWHRAVGHEVPALRSGTRVADWIEGAVMLLPTESFRRVGGFDERFFMYSEEVDLQRRTHDLSMPSVVVGDVCAEHIGGASSDDPKRLAWLLQGEWIYFDKWAGPAGGSRYKAAMFTVTVVNLLWNSIRAALGRDTRTMAAFHLWWGAIRGASDPTGPARTASAD